MNPLYQQLLTNSPINGVGNLFQNFLQFRNGFKGNAQEEIQKLLNSGRISQEQYNNAVLMAEQLKGFLK